MSLDGRRTQPPDRSRTSCIDTTTRLLTQGKPVARRGRKARGLTQVARPPAPDDGPAGPVSRTLEGWPMMFLRPLKRNPKRRLGALAALFAAGAFAAGSGANFTATSANPSNTFSTG